MVEMSCEEHDRHAASTQFITHTVGRMLGAMQLQVRQARLGCWLCPAACLPSVLVDLPPSGYGAGKERTARQLGVCASCAPRGHRSAGGAGRCCRQAAGRFRLR